MSDTAETYFDNDYLGPTLWTGLLLWPMLSQLGLELIQPFRAITGYDKYTWNNLFTRYAWNSMIGGHETWYSFMWVVWLFSFIQKPFFQKSMFWSYVVGMCLNFLSLTWVNIAFLIAGVSEGGNWGDLYWALIYDVVFFGLNAIVYYVTLPKMAKFYRWREQDWWRWDKDLERGGIDLDFEPLMSV